MDATATMSHTDSHAFETLLEQHRGIVFKVAHTYCRDPDDRSDLAQDIATQLWRAWPGYDPARAFSTWLYRIALNVAISHVRSTSRHRARAVAFDPDLHELSSDADPLEADDALRMLRKVIDALEPLDRALLLLHLDERTPREIADVLGLSPSNVTTKIHRLKQRIRARMEPAA